MLLPVLEMVCSILLFCMRAEAGRQKKGRFYINPCFARATKSSMHIFSFLFLCSTKAVAIVAQLAQSLKRERVGYISKIETKLAIAEYPPHTRPMMEVEISRGEFGEVIKLLPFTFLLSRTHIYIYVCFADNFRLPSPKDN